MALAVEGRWTRITKAYNHTQRDQDGFKGRVATGKEESAHDTVVCQHSLHSFLLLYPLRNCLQVRALEVTEMGGVHY